MDDVNKQKESHLQHNIDRVSNVLQSVRLDSSPKVSMHYESDIGVKKAVVMSPSLSHYFGGGSENSSSSIKNDTANFLNEMKQFSQSNNTDYNQTSLTTTVLSKDKDEPVICRIFAESNPQPTQSADPTKNFFDMIGQSKVTFGTSTGLVSDVGLYSDEFEVDDTFNSSLSIGNEADRRRDAWIPIESTRKALIASATSAPGMYFPEQDLLTMPGVILEETLNDMLHDVVAHYLGGAEAAQRKILTANDVTQDERGLRELIQAGCYRAAINLTGQILSIYGQGVGRAGHPSKHSPHSLQLWFTRLALLIKIKSFVLAEQEAEPFGQLDKPDIYFQFYPDMYGGRPGSIASFSFRLLIAELPMHCNKPRESIKRLYNLLATIRKIVDNLKQGLSEDGNPMELSETDKNDSLKLWTGREARVQHSIVNCGLVLRDYSLAIQVMKELINNHDWSDDHKKALHSTLGRIHLQLGDVVGAECCFGKSREFNKSAMPLTRDLIDKSLVAVAQNSYCDAYKLLVQASQIEPSNIMIMNNMGVCLLYMGRLKEAISLLENAVNSNPTRGLNDSLLLNLCTLYELESSHSNNKKLALLRQLARYKADVGMNIQACLKLQA